MAYVSTRIFLVLYILHLIYQWYIAFDISVIYCVWYICDISLTGVIYQCMSIHFSIYVTIATEMRLSAQNRFFFGRKKSLLTCGDDEKSRRSRFPCFLAIWKEQKFRRKHKNVVKNLKFGKKWVSTITSTSPNNPGTKVVYGPSYSTSHERWFCYILWYLYQKVWGHMEIRKNTFTFGLKAAENTPNSKKSFKQKYFGIEFWTKKSTSAYVNLPWEWC